MRSGAFVYTPDAARFTYGPDHPFDPERAVKVYELCDRYSLLAPDRVRVVTPRPVAEADLRLAHTAAYLAALRQADSGGGFPDAARWGLGTPDCPIFPGVFRFAEISAGASLAALAAVREDGAQVAFNPSGGFHHAHADRAEGFCYINDCVILIETLRAAGARPCFVDVDAHQPNGVVAPYWRDPSVLVVTFHETPRTLYPFTGYCEEMGEGPGRGYTVNVPLEPGADDEIFEELFTRIVPRALDRFQPDCIVYEAGMDMLKGDPLAHLGLSTNALTRASRLLADTGVPVVALGGGGYNVRHTVRGWTRMWAALLGIEPQDAFAGVVGGMMFGPEAQAGTLIDPPVVNMGESKARAASEAARVCAYLEHHVLPLIAPH